MKIGDIEILPVLDGSARIPPTAAYAGTTEEDWAPHGGSWTRTDGSRWRSGVSSYAPAIGSV